MKYLVMECHPGYAVLLDEEGRFRRAANLHYEVGQKVDFPVLMKEAPPPSKNVIRWIGGGGVAAVAACLLLFFGLHYYPNYMAPYTSIYLSINPQVRIVLNRQGTVVDLEGINADGKALLQGYDGRKKDKITVSDELIDRAIEMGFLSKGGQVSFSIDAPDQVVFTEYGVELRREVAQHLESRMEVTVKVLDHKAIETTTSQSQPPQSQSAQRENPTQAAPQTPAPPPPSQGSSHPDIPAAGGQNPTPQKHDTDYSDTDYDPPESESFGTIPPSSPGESPYDPEEDKKTDYDSPEEDQDDDSWEEPEEEKEEEDEEEEEK